MIRSLCCALLLAASPAVCTIIYQTGFEPAAYQLGTLEGQQGWQILSVGEPPPVYVQKSVVKSGTQALAVEANLETQQSGAWRNILFDTAPLLDEIVAVSANLYLSGGQSLSGWQFALLAPQLGAGIAGFNVDPDGRVRLISADSRELPLFIERERWMSIRLELDFNGQTFDLLIDEQVVAAAVPFYTRQTVLGSLVFDTFSTADPLTANDIGYLDNLLIRQQKDDTEVVPEPASLWMLGTGAGVMWLLGRHRRRLRSTPASRG